MPKHHKNNHSKISVVSRDGMKIPLANTDGELRPAFQTHATLGHYSEYTIPITPTAPSTALSNGSIVYYDLEPQECGLIEGYPELRIKITNNGASSVVMPPVFYWFRRILIEEAKGTGDELARLYPENWVMWFSSLPEEKRNYWQKRCGFSLSQNPENGSQVLAYSDNSTTIKASETRYFYLPIIWSPFEHRAVDMEHLSAELRFTLEFAPSVGISGTLSDLSVDDLSLIIKSFEEYQQDKHERHKRHNGKEHKFIYLDTERLQINDKNVANSSETRYPLDTFYGKSPYMLSVFKASTNPVPTSNVAYNYIQLGTNSTFDLENTSGVSLLGNGTPMRSEQLQKAYVEETNTPFLKGAYLVKFDEDIKKSNLGIPNGFYSFQGRKDSLVVNAGGSGSSTTYTFSPLQVEVGATGDPFSGKLVSAKINGLETNISIGTTATGVLNEFNENPFLKERNVAATSITNLHDLAVDGDDVVITFAAKDDWIHDEIKDIKLDVKTELPSASSTERIVAFDTPTISRGSQGFASGSGYSQEIYMLKFKELCIHTNGRMSCKDL